MIKAFGYELDPTVIDNEAIDFFTLGQCWALAEVLSNKLGWRQVFQMWDDTPDFWRHVMVEHPVHGFYLDIRGWQDPEAADYPVAYEVLTPHEQARDCSGWHDVGFQYYRKRSLQIANLYLPKVLEYLLED